MIFKCNFYWSFWGQIMDSFADNLLFINSTLSTLEKELHSENKLDHTVVSL